MLFSWRRWAEHGRRVPLRSPLLVTEDGGESPEIMYLRDGVNGFVVARGNIPELAKKLLLLIDNDELRHRFSDEARKEIARNGNIDKFCAGFRDALFYVTG